MHQVNDFIAKQGLWRGACWGMALVCMIDGSTYFVKGNTVATGPSFHLIRSQPGGLTLYGACMLFLAALIIYASAEREKYGRRIMLGVFIASFWVCLEITIGMVQANQGFVPGNISKWFFMMWVALWLAGTAEHPPRR